jgi:hypothetical protein
MGTLKKENQNLPSKEKIIKSRKIDKTPSIHIQKKEKKVTTLVDDTPKIKGTEVLLDGF